VRWDETVTVKILDDLEKGTDTLINLFHFALQCAGIPEELIGFI
jgi:hypothetical protein